MAKKREQQVVDVPRCIQCGEPGGRRRVDPYQQDVYNERIIVRLHDRCVAARCEDI